MPIRASSSRSLRWTVCLWQPTRASCCCLVDSCRILRSARRCMAQTGRVDAATRATRLMGLSFLCVLLVVGGCSAAVRDAYWDCQFRQLAADYAHDVVLAPAAGWTPKRAHDALATVTNGLNLAECNLTHTPAEGATSPPVATAVWPPTESVEGSEGEAGRVTVYVSTSGSDTAAGTAEAPLKTVAGAQAWIRARSVHPPVSLHAHHTPELACVVAIWREERGGGGRGVSHAVTPHFLYTCWSIMLPGTQWCGAGRQSRWRSSPASSPSARTPLVTTSGQRGEWPSFSCVASLFHHIHHISTATRTYPPTLPSSTLTLNAACPTFTAHSVQVLQPGNGNLH